ncbi:response regulator [Planctomycetota bacterium]
MVYKIIIADDQQLFREGICSLLAQQADMEVVGQTDDGVGLEQMVREQQPNVVIMDVNIPRFNGAEAIQGIVTEFSNVKVIALSMHNNRLFVKEMFKAGVSGFLLKQCSFAELLEAIRTAVDDQVYLSPRLASVMVDGYMAQTPDADQAKDAELTDREYQVVRLLSEGKSTKEIAAHIDMSVQTVDGCRRQIMKKLNLENLAQLVKYAIREGFTHVES